MNLDAVPSCWPPVFGHELVSFCLGESHFKLRVSIYRYQSMKKGIQLFLVM